MTRLSLLAAAALAITVTACSTTPKEEVVPVVDAKPERPMMEPNPDSQPQTVERAPIINEGPIADGPMPGTVDDFVENVGDRVFFGYDQHNLSAQATNVLANQAKWLMQYPTTIVIIGGHADERGTRDYNLALGSRRAEAVKDYLVSQGVSPNRITTVSYGKERPIAGGSDEQSWAMNRNAHTAIVSGNRS